VIANYRIKVEGIVWQRGGNRDDGHLRRARLLRNRWCRRAFCLLQELCQSSLLAFLSLQSFSFLLGLLCFHLSLLFLLSFFFIRHSLIEGPPDHLEHIEFDIPQADDLEKGRQEYTRYGVDAHDNRPSLVQAVKDAGMQHFSVPIEDMHIASKQTWKYAMDIAPKILKQVMAGGYAHVHCVGGHGRTGTFVAQLVLAAKMDALVEQARLDAIKAVRAARHDTIETKEQEEDVDRGVDLWDVMSGYECKKIKGDDGEDDAKKAADAKGSKKMAFAQQQLEA
jgi:Protein-tyrosine phosphatase